MNEGAQRAQVDEDAPMDSTGEKQEYSFCSHRRAEINHLLEENKLLKVEFSLKKMDEHFLQIDNIRVEQCTGLHHVLLF